MVVSAAGCAQPGWPVLLQGQRERQREQRHAHCQGPDRCVAQPCCPETMVVCQSGCCMLCFGHSCALLLMCIYLPAGKAQLFCCNNDRTIKVRAYRTSASAVFSRLTEQHCPGASGCVVSQSLPRFMFDRHSACQRWSVDRRFRQKRPSTTLRSALMRAPSLLSATSPTCEPRTH